MESSFLTAEATVYTEKNIDMTLDIPVLILLMYYFCVYSEDIIKMLKKKNLGGTKPPRRRQRRCLCPEPVLVAP